MLIRSIYIYSWFKSHTCNDSFTILLYEPIVPVLILGHGREVKANKNTWDKTHCVVAANVRKSGVCRNKGDVRAYICQGFRVVKLTPKWTILDAQLNQKFLTADTHIETIRNMCVYISCEILWTLTLNIPQFYLFSLSTWQLDISAHPWPLPTWNSRRARGVKKWGTQNMSGKRVASNTRGTRWVDG